MKFEPRSGLVLRSRAGWCVEMLGREEQRVTDPQGRVSTVFVESLGTGSARELAIGFGDSGWCPSLTEAERYDVLGIVIDAMCTRQPDVGMVHVDLPERRGGDWQIRPAVPAQSPAIAHATEGWTVAIEPSGRALVIGNPDGTERRVGTQPYVSHREVLRPRADGIRLERAELWDPQDDSAQYAWLRVSIEGLRTLRPTIASVHLAV